MKMTVCAGAVALAMTGLLSNVASVHAREITANAEMAQSSASINIARIKSALKLTPAQEPYWAPVEAALRDLNHRQAQSEGDGLVRRISHRVVSIALNSATIQKLAAAARPLIGVLDAEQMRTAHGLAQEMGLGPVVAALR
jgi:hypothetical protein